MLMPFPESPRWLMKKNRYRKAFESLCRLRSHRIQAARDLYYVHAQLVVESELAAGSTYFSRLCELISVPRIRRSTIASLVVFMGQQFCGKLVASAAGVKSNSHGDPQE